MVIGGVWVEERHVRKLVLILERSLSRRLEQALLFRAQVVALTREEKRAVLSALERAPELTEVRESLLADEHWREGGRRAVG